MITCPDCQSNNTDDSKFCKACAAPLQETDHAAFQETKTIGKPHKVSHLEGARIGKYEILDKVGAGGMGLVFKAQDTKLKRIVALKFLPLDLMRDQEYYQRFIQEAQAASMLEHPNICTIHEIDETDTGQCYMAMTYYEGGTLRQKVESGPLTVDQSLDIAIQVAHGLSKAHSHSIVHRDIKPANIIVMDDGLAVILDFGLAKLSNQTRLTRQNTILGTVAYMSPEQASGRDVDQRSDIWSFGGVLYEMLTGHIPFDGDNEQAVIFGILKKPPIPPTDYNPDIPSDFEKIILRCLHKITTQRYQSVDDLLSDLESLRSSRLFKKHETAASAPRKSGIQKDSELRQATIMLVRIMGYTKLREKSDVEEAAALMQSCYEICSSVDEKYGGRINKIEEDTLQFSFGVPQAIEDAPQKAVNAAIEIRANLLRFNQEEVPEIPLNVRIGINTGSVIVGAIGTGPTQDYFVMGDTVNVASGILDAARDGQIIVGPLTHKHTGVDFRYSALAPVALEGAEAPVSIYELLSIKQKVHRAQPAKERIIQSEMVGRDQELDKLLDHVRKAVNLEGSILSVIGEAGIGKSRLMAEFKQKAGRTQVNILEGRAISIGRNLSFFPVIDILKNWAGIQEQDDPSKSFHKLETAVLDAYPEGLAEVLPFIATLMGLKLPSEYEARLKGIEGEALEKLILVNLRKLIIKVARAKPLVFILEDLHWSDSSSLDLLKALFRVAEEHPVLFINVFRPNYEDTSERLLNSVRARFYHLHEEICLESLDQDNSEQLLRNLLKIEGFPPRLMKRISGITGGNPFFIEEIVRSLIDQEAVEVKDGRFQVTKKIDQVEIPSTIDEVLLSRIDRLDDETRSLLRVASVIGRNFFYKILADVADTLPDIDDKLFHLKNIQLILERKSLQEVEYLFKHALAQEAAYKAILSKQRQALHLKIADSIQKVFAPRIQEFFGMLAYHYTRGEDLERAEEFLIKSGEEALKSSASSEALNYYQEALDIYSRRYGQNIDPNKIAQLEKCIALAYYNKGQYQESVEYYDRVQPYLLIKLPSSKAGMMLKFINSFMHLLIGLYLPFLKWHRVPSRVDHEIINLFYLKCLAMGHVDPKRVFIESLFLIKRMTRLDLKQLENGIAIFAGASLAFSWTGMSFPLARKILDFIEDKIDKDDLKSTIYFQTDDQTLNFFVGEWQNQEFDEKLVEQGIRIAEIFSISNYTIFHGRTFLEQGRFKAAMHTAERLEEISVLFEHEYPMALKYFLKTKLLFKYRQLPEAIKEAEQGILFNKKTRLGTLLLGLHALKARMMILMRDIESAEALLEQAETVMSEMNVTPCYLSEYLLARLSLEMFHLAEAVQRGNGADVAELGRTAMKTARQTLKNASKVASDRVEAHRLMGRCLWLLGDNKKALRSWESGIRAGETLGAQLELARTMLEVGERLQEPQSDVSELKGVPASEYAEKAELMLNNMRLEID